MIEPRDTNVHTYIYTYILGVPFGTRAVCRSWWQLILICQALNWRAAGVGSWTAPIFHIHDTVESLIQVLASHISSQMIHSCILSSSRRSLSDLELSSSADEVAGWHIRNNLLLNANKTVAIVTGIRQQVAKFRHSSDILMSVVTLPFIANLRVFGIINPNQPLIVR